jgi:hypothetical protein
MPASSARVKRLMLMSMWLQYTHLWGSEFVLRNECLTRRATRGMTKGWQGHCAHASLCCVVVCCASRSVAVRLNICSKLVRNTLQWFCWFPILVWPNLTVRSAARKHLQYTVPWQLIFVLVLSTHIVWAWTFSAPCIHKALLIKNAEYHRSHILICHFNV